MLRILIEEDGKWPEGPPPNWERNGRPWPPFERRPFKIEKVGFRWTVEGEIEGGFLKVMQAIDDSLGTRIPKIGE